MKHPVHLRGWGAFTNMSGAITGRVLDLSPENFWILSSGNSTF